MRRSANENQKQGKSKTDRRGELSPEELRFISDDFTQIDYSFDELIEVFIEDCDFRNLREHTLKFYRNELKATRNLLSEQNLSLKAKDITGEIIKHNVIMFMRSKGIKTVSINSRLRALRAFFNLLEGQKILVQNPMKEIKLLKDRRRIIETFDKEQLRALFKTCNLRTFIGLRDYTIMLLLLETGVRANELIGIKTEDIMWSQKVIRITNAKGGYERFVPVQNIMIDQLKKYLKVRGSIDTDYLFITQDDSPLSKKQMQDRIRLYGQEAKIKNVRCSPHTFRHTFAKMSVLGGCNAFILQSILGHSSIEQSRVYVNLFSNEVQENHSKFSPLNNLL
ncbi:tyrosine-type recombinase/integrase [Fictibacillus halophilus]|uniref:tyrosine-type recombinase/integrase n=1 Tax=Fictibacillus halophilus TaxID=1610490 RepID=UPI001CFAEF35|nr:tyrosine-type recombinase/integrase [Fictibacillus halophilus]